MATDLRQQPGPLDAATFDHFYRLHRAEIFRHVLREVGNRADAEEITQTAFLDAYRALRRGHEPEQPRAWMHGIARNAARRMFRTASRRPREVELRPELAEDLVADDAAELDGVRAAVAGLRPSYREVVFLREVEGLSYTEIAERMELSHAAVETLLFRARRVLRDRLEAEGLRPAVQGGRLRRLRGAFLAPAGLLRLAARATDFLHADVAGKAAAGAALAAVGAGVVVGTGGPVATADTARRPAPAPAHVAAAPPAAVPVHRTALPPASSASAGETQQRTDGGHAKKRRDRDGGRRHHAHTAGDAAGGSSADAAQPAASETTSGSTAPAPAGGGSTSGGTSSGSGGAAVTVQTSPVEIPSVTVTVPDVPVVPDLPPVSTPPVTVPPVTVTVPDDPVGDAVDTVGDAVDTVTGILGG